MTTRQACREQLPTVSSRAPRAVTSSTRLSQRLSRALSSQMMTPVDEMHEHECSVKALDERSSRFCVRQQMSTDQNVARARHQRHHRISATTSSRSALSRPTSSSSLSFTSTHQLLIILVIVSSTVSIIEQATSSRTTSHIEQSSAEVISQHVEQKTTADKRTPEGSKSNANAAAAVHHAPALSRDAPGDGTEIPAKQDAPKDVKTNRTRRSSSDDADDYRHSSPAGVCDDCLAIPMVALVGRKQVNGFILHPSLRNLHEQQQQQQHNGPVANSVTAASGGDRGSTSNNQHYDERVGGTHQGFNLYDNSSSSSSSGPGEIRTGGRHDYEQAQSLIAHGRRRSPPQQEQGYTYQHAANKPAEATTADGGGGGGAGGYGDSSGRRYSSSSHQRADTSNQQQQQQRPPPQQAGHYKRVVYEEQNYDHASPFEPKSDEKCPMTGPLTVCDQISSYPADAILHKLASAKRALHKVAASSFDIDSLFSDEGDGFTEPFGLTSTTMSTVAMPVHSTTTTTTTTPEPNPPPPPPPPSETNHRTQAISYVERNVEQNPGAGYYHQHQRQLQSQSMDSAHQLGHQHSSSSSDSSSAVDQSAQPPQRLLQSMRRAEVNNQRTSFAAERVPLYPAQSTGGGSRLADGLLESTMGVELEPPLPPPPPPLVSQTNLRRHRQTKRGAQAATAAATRTLNDNDFRGQQNIGQQQQQRQPDDLLYLVERKGLSIESRRDQSVTVKNHALTGGAEAESAERQTRVVGGSGDGRGNGASAELLSWHNDNLHRRGERQMIMEGSHNDDAAAAAAAASFQQNNRTGHADSASPVMLSADSAGALFRLSVRSESSHKVAQKPGESHGSARRPHPIILKASSSSSSTSSNANARVLAVGRAHSKTSAPLKLIPDIARHERIAQANHDDGAGDNGGEGNASEESDRDQEQRQLPLHLPKYAMGSQSNVRRAQSAHAGADRLIADDFDTLEAASSLTTTQRLRPPSPPETLKAAAAAASASTSSTRLPVLASEGPAAAAAAAAVARARRFISSAGQQHFWPPPPSSTQVANDKKSQSGQFVPRSSSSPKHQAASETAFTGANFEVAQEGRSIDETTTMTPPTTTMVEIFPINGTKPIVKLSHNNERREVAPRLGVEAHKLSSSSSSSSLLINRFKRQMPSNEQIGAGADDTAERNAEEQDPDRASGESSSQEGDDDQAASRPQPVCRAKSIYISPRAAMNHKKQWKYVVNAPERDPRIKQIIRVDICHKQKYAKKKLLALDSRSGLLEVDTFFIPSCCVCQLVPDSTTRFNAPASTQDDGVPTMDNSNDNERRTSADGFATAVASNGGRSMTRTA